MGGRPALLHRWVQAFVDAGTAQVTNNPDSDAARQRDRFLAAFAHELRTPLTVARGWGELLLEGDLPPEMVATTVQRLHDALGRLAERTLDVQLLAAASWDGWPCRPARHRRLARRRAARHSGVEGEGPDLTSPSTR